MSKNDLFKVLVTFKGGSRHTDTDWTTDLDVIKSSLTRLIQGPGRFLVHEIKVIDALDCTVYLYRAGKQVWPEAA